MGNRPASQPATMWPLNSKGILEELIGALQIRFKHAV